MMIITIITAIRLLYILPDIQLAVNQRGLLLFLNFFSTIHFNIVVCDFLYLLFWWKVLEKELKQYGVINYVPNNTIYLSKSKYIR